MVNKSTTSTPLQRAHQQRNWFKFFMAKKLFIRPFTRDLPLSKGTLERVEVINSHIEILHAEIDADYKRYMQKLRREDGNSSK